MDRRRFAVLVHGISTPGSASSLPSSQGSRRGEYLTPNSSVTTSRAPVERSYLITAGVLSDLRSDVDLLQIGAQFSGDVKCLSPKHTRELPKTSSNVPATEQLDSAKNKPHVLVSQDVSVYGTADGVDGFDDSGDLQHGDTEGTSTK